MPRSWRSKFKIIGGKGADISELVANAMGITGLLPFLKGIQRDVNVSSMKGWKVGIDAYCWLHKGAYSCATQLVMKTADIKTL